MASTSEQRDDLNDLLRGIHSAVSAVGQQGEEAESLASLLQRCVEKEAMLQREEADAKKLQECQSIIAQLQEEIATRQLCIRNVHRCLMDAETTLITSIFQANQKLKSITAANNAPVDAADLIKFAHRISASHSVAAPPTWQLGDAERPFPTPDEMRCGWLGGAQAVDQTVSADAYQMQLQNVAESLQSSSQFNLPPPATRPTPQRTPRENTALCPPSSVEIMSSDSSSSSTSGDEA